MYQKNNYHRGNSGSTPVNKQHCNLLIPVKTSFNSLEFKNKGFKQNNNIQFLYICRFLSCEMLTGINFSSRYHNNLLIAWLCFLKRNSRADQWMKAKIYTGACYCTCEVCLKGDNLWLSRLGRQGLQRLTLTTLSQVCSNSQASDAFFATNTESVKMNGDVRK